MSNTTKISNTSELTQMLFKEYFEYQIKSDHNLVQTYLKRIKDPLSLNKGTEFYNSILDFINLVHTNRPIVVFFFDKSIPVEVPDNVFFVTETDLSNQSTVSRLRNCLLIICDSSLYNNRVLWNRSKRNAVSEMNPEVTFIIN
ncbi:TPA: hypothetical protein NV937_000815 [Escherichia coli]|uniref:Uncharacterized protein n=1 Tax=Escherichia phage fEgEco12 TaxID=3158837 RepID=A0AAU7PGV8_9CAUD|nr:hypothetical protein [Escherichia coli]ELW0836176.1 hypothetical protein [Escherichia coli]QAY00545.1 hypothetical protein Ecwhy1_266 [Escherichia phage Ecwhy_1]HBB3760952.1 hypothetical protein [Escherichia coli]HCJ9510137.1 hypothetical protein [Escherichia coli]